MRRDQFDALEPVDHAGTASIFRPSEMLASQHLTLRRILLRIYEIAEREAAFETKLTTDIYQKILTGRAPRQVFFIDGARGAGKTTLLLTLQQLMRFLGRPDKRKPKSFASAPKPRELLFSLEREIREAIKLHPMTPLDANDRQLVTDLPGLDPATFSFFNQHRAGTEAPRHTAHFLPIIFPSDLELGQPVMEAVFSLLSDSLTRAVERRRQALKDKADKDEGFKALADTAERLRERIHSDVAKGWYLARREGVDAILRDSADYVDFLNKMGEAGEAAHSRVTAWRDFVNDFLAFAEAETLVLSFDDTDNKPDATAEILHTTRVFLSHPRIITIIAGNLRSMRQSLILEDMGRLQSAVGSLGSDAPETARDWRRFARQQIEEVLEKTLPRPNRSYISFRSPQRSVPSRALSTSATAPTDDFQRLFEMSFDAYCAAMLNAARDEYFEAKHKATVRYLIGAVEFQTVEDRASLERFIAWWLFRNRYGRALRPRTARHLIAMRDLTLTDNKSPAFSHRLPFEHGKRLAVILFEAPDNFDLLQRFGDSDTDVVQWLHRQHVRSCWTGDRYIEINHRKIFEDSYSHQFVFFRMDLGIALPLRDNAEARVPNGLMPRADGPNLNGLPTFFARMPVAERYGFARALAHSLIPNNCLYFFDAQSLPDIVWESPDVEGKPSCWGARLIYDWPQLFSFRAPPQMAETASSAPPPVDLPALQNYLVEVVFPFASLQFSRFAQPPPNGSAKLIPMPEMGRQHLLAAEREHDFFRSMLAQMDRLRRQFDYLGQVSQNFMAQGPANDVAGDVLRAWRASVMERISPSGDLAAATNDALGAAIKEQLLRYRWLLNDMRQGWHASRIFLNEIADAVAQIDLDNPKSAGKEPSTTWRDAFARTDPYELTTRAQFDWWLGRSPTLRDLIAKWERKASVAPARGETWLEAPNAEQQRRDLRQRLARIVPSINVARDGTIDLSLDSMNDILRARRQGDEDPNWPFIVDPGSMSMVGEHSSRDAVHGRLARSYSLFLYALSPCLPSAIHLEVASLFYAGRTLPTDTAAAARACLLDWQARVLRFLAFAQEYRAVCEFIKLRLDIWDYLRAATDDAAVELSSKRYPTPTLAGVNLSLFPDFSFISLGVQGLRTWGLTTRGDQPNDVLAPPTESLLSNTIHNLVEALNFIVMTLATIETPAPISRARKTTTATAKKRRTAAKRARKIR